MTKAGDSPYDGLIRALSRAEKKIPKDLRHLSLAEIKKLWQDPAERPRIEKAFAPLVKAAAPAIQDTLDLLRQIHAGAVGVAQWVQRTQQQLLAARQKIQQAQAWVRRAPRLAAQYCQPYQRQIEALRESNLPPLTPEEEWTFLITASLIANRRERALGKRPPLEHVALIHERLDLAVAILMHQRPELRAKARTTNRLPDDWEDLDGEVFLALREQILPSVLRRAGKVTLSHGRLALDELLSNQYLVASVIRAIGRRRHRVHRHVERETPLADLSGREEEKATDALDVLAVEQALREYFAQSDRAKLDRQILAAARAKVSMARLSQQTGVPERTLRHRRRKLIEFCRSQLGLPE